MHARKWFIGLSLSIAVVGNAVAANVTTQGSDDAGSRAGAHSSHAHASGTDALTWAGDASGHNGSDNADSGSANSSGDDHSSDSLPGPAPLAAPRHAQLGWQSLLPGSIQ